MKVERKLAEDGYLPDVLTGKHARYGTPWLAIVASALIYALLTAGIFGWLWPKAL